MVTHAHVGRTHAHPGGGATHAHPVLFALIRRNAAAHAGWGAFGVIMGAVMIAVGWSGMQDGPHLQGDPSPFWFFIGIGVAFAAILALLDAAASVAAVMIERRRTVR